MTDDQAYGVAADELRQFVEQIEAAEAEKADIAEVIKEHYAEAKARGYCVRTLKRIVLLRKKSKDERDEADAIEEMYKEALGM